MVEQCQTRFNINMPGLFSIIPVLDFEQIWTAVGFLRPSPQLASQPSLRLGCRGAHLLCLASLNTLHTLYLSFICVFYSLQLLEDLRCFNPRTIVEHMLRQRQTLVLGCEASGASRHCESTFATARALF